MLQFFRNIVAIDLLSVSSDIDYSIQVRLFILLIVSDV